MYVHKHDRYRERPYNDRYCVCSYTSTTKCTLIHSSLTDTVLHENHQMTNTVYVRTHH